MKRMSMGRGLKLGRCFKRKKKSNDKQKASEQQINKGDKVDLSTLLFTKYRNYLLRGDNQRVQAKQLDGKVIVLYFMNLLSGHNYWMHETTCLVDIYNEMQPKGCLEVVFVAAPDATDCSNPEVYSTSEEQRFKERYSIMPWLSIPFSDFESRKHLAKRFGGISGFMNRYPVSFVVDPAGVVLQCNGGYYFQEFGAPGYPFSDEKINILISEDEAARQHPSITTLLASPDRDYVISNSGGQVPVSDLEDKVVALYFFEEPPVGESPDDLTPKIEMVYRELAKKGENFEVVLIYAHDTVMTYDCTTEVSFQRTFSTMPWLALPFKDPNCKKLQRIFAATPSLTHPPFALDSPWLTHPAFAYDSDERKLFLSVFHFGRGLLAFDKDGRLLRRTISPSVESEDADFPFHSGSLEEDAVIELVSRFDWRDS